MDCVTFDPQYERALHYALGSSIITEDTESAKHIIYEQNEQVKAVTLGGTVFHKGGTITGGSSDGSTASAGKRWEDKELES